MLRKYETGNTSHAFPPSLPPSLPPSFITHANEEEGGAVGVAGAEKEGQEEEEE